MMSEDEKIQYYKKSVVVLYDELIALDDDSSVETVATSKGPPGHFEDRFNKFINVVEDFIHRYKCLKKSYKELQAENERQACQLNDEVKKTNNMRKQLSLLVKERKSMSLQRSNKPPEHRTKKRKNAKKMRQENDLSKKSPHTLSIKKPYSCDECGKMFSNSSHVSRHVDSIHRKIRHACLICHRSYSQKESLRFHTCKATN